MLGSLAEISWKEYLIFEPLLVKARRKSEETGSHVGKVCPSFREVEVSSPFEFLPAN